MKSDLLGPLLAADQPGLFFNKLPELGSNQQPFG